MKGELLSGNLRFPVYILDEKVSFGRDLYYITPQGGKGEKWVDAGSVWVYPQEEVSA